ncbi:MAG: tRNA (adenosine(37)-N6)-threonylcarbamoyltransferase complex dimerization subunit type 1 TsaB [Massiliimalia sp.]
MKILAVDTTAKACSVSLIQDNRVLAENFVNLNFTHSQTMMPMCQQLLENAKISLKEVDAFAVSTGPGSFTGLRIGLSAVKGMAFALQKPCIGVSTLDALAQNVAEFPGIICAVMDARCHQVYNALYENQNGVLNKLTDDRALMIDELLEQLKNFQKPIILVGDGADLCYNAYKDILEQLVLAHPQNRFQRASSVGMLAAQKAEQGEFLSPSEILPSYLRLPQAQRELLQKKQQQNQNHQKGSEKE